MIWQMEIACAELISQHVPDTQTSVGFHVDVKHVAPALPGAQLTTKVKVRSVDGRKITFAVEVRDGDRLVGTGKHRRAVVEVSDLG